MPIRKCLRVLRIRLVNFCDRHGCDHAKGQVQVQVQGQVQGQVQVEVEVEV